jgi:16S rRNA U1498 N3-methylase RsmE
VDTPLPLLSYLGSLAQATADEVLRFVLEPERAQRTEALADSMDTAFPSAASRAEIAIGPEGGFAPEELEAFDLSPLRLSSFYRRNSGICRLFPTLRRDPQTLDGSAS